MTTPAVASRQAEFEETAMPHIHALHSFALRFTRRREEAEDLVQETLLRGFRFFHRYEAGTNIRAWLFKIMRNLFINRYRKVQREPDTLDYGGVESALESLLQAEATENPSGKTPEEVLLAGSVDDRVEQAMGELPEEYRSVLLLSAMGELSYKEIATVLSIPIGTVMSRLHRARRLMQAQLLDYAREQGLVAATSPESGRVVKLARFRSGRRG